jgi:hypothetical protein
MEHELGLKRPVSRKLKRVWAAIAASGGGHKYFGRYETLNLARPINKKSNTTKTSRPLPPLPYWAQRKEKQENIPDSEKLQFAKRPDHERTELLIWAWENKRLDILYSFGIILSEGYFEM